MQFAMKGGISAIIVMDMALKYGGKQMFDGLLLVYELFGKRPRAGAFFFGSAGKRIAIFFLPIGLGIVGFYLFGYPGLAIAYKSNTNSKPCQRRYEKDSRQFLE
jgi:hypothetical protein